MKILNQKNFRPELCSSTSLLSQTMKCHVSLLLSTLEFDFGSSPSLWLTDERAIRLHQKVQPDSLIWQPSSNQIYSLFLALHQLDKKKSGKKNDIDNYTLLYIHCKMIEKNVQLTKCHPVFSFPIIFPSFMLLHNTSTYQTNDWQIISFALYWFRPETNLYLLIYWCSL